MVGIPKKKMVAPPAAFSFCLGGQVRSYSKRQSTFLVLMAALVMLIVVFHTIDGPWQHHPSSSSFDAAAAHDKRIEVSRR